LLPCGEDREAAATVVVLRGDPFTACRDLSSSRQGKSLCQESLPGKPLVMTELLRGRMPNFCPVETLSDVEKQFERLQLHLGKHFRVY